MEAFEACGKASPFWLSGGGRWPCFVGASDANDMKAVAAPFALGRASGMMQPND